MYEDLTLNQLERYIQDGVTGKLTILETQKLIEFLLHHFYELDSILFQCPQCRTKLYNRHSVRTHMGGCEFGAMAKIGRNLFQSKTT